MRKTLLASAGLLGLGLALAGPVMAQGSGATGSAGAMPGTTGASTGQALVQPGPGQNGMVPGGAAPHGTTAHHSARRHRTHRAKTVQQSG